MTLRRLTYLLLTAFCIVLAACSDDDKQQTRTPQMYMQVRIGLADGTPATSRAATPYGGDDGDGREQGINNENKVYGLTLLLFDEDVTANTAAVVKRQMHFTADQLKAVDSYTYELKEPYALDAVYTTYYVVAIVNDSYDYTGKKFSEVADIVVKTPWQGNGNTADHFVMASAGKATLTTYRDDSKGSYTDPFLTEVSVERLAARIDIDNTGHNTDGDFTYDYKNELGAKVGTVKIIDIQAFNLLNSGTYLLKHYSTDGTAAKLNFFGSEGTSPAQTQYVLDPNTLQKTTSASPTYYTKPFDGISDLAADITWAAPTLTADQTVASGIDAGHKYFILTYLQENTLPPMTESESATLMPRYATVLAVKYEINEGTPVTKYDYYYLLHNNGTASPAVTDPMRYSIVRNNIYRVTLLPPVKGGSSSLEIKVKVWDKFTHSWIYM